MNEAAIKKFIKTIPYWHRRPYHWFAFDKRGWEVAIHPFGSGNMDTCAKVSVCMRSGHRNDVFFTCDRSEVIGLS
jgi:hypothetical protein